MDKPAALPLQPENIPAELKAAPRWVVWRYAKKKGKWTKVPISCRTGLKTDVTDVKNLVSFEQALAYHRNRRGETDGVGFAFLEEDPYSGIDLDKCRNPATGALEPWAQAIVLKAASYAEVSPSGTGVKVIVRGKLAPGSRTRKGQVEVYSRGRYFAFTGAHLPNTPRAVEDRQQFLLKLHEQLAVDDAAGTDSSGARWGYEPSDDAVITRARGAANHDKFERLFVAGDVSGYKSASEADLALCGMLAFWLGDHATPERVERLFGRSPLASRGKWAERADYRERTIDQALRGRRDYCNRDEVLTRTIQENQDDLGKRNTAGSLDGGCMTLPPDLMAKAVQTAEDLAASRRVHDEYEAMFALARRLRPLAGDAHGPLSFRQAVEAYCTAAGLPAQDAEHYLYALEDCWDRVLLAEGERPLSWAYLMAARDPYTPTPCLGEMYGRLAGIAYHLSRLLRGRRPFLLPVKDLAELFGTNLMRVSRVIALLEKYRVIRCVNENYSYVDHRAKEYVFLGQETVAA